MDKPRTFLIGQMPNEVLLLPLTDVLQLLEQAFGASLYAAFDPESRIPGPYANHPDSSWIKKANTVGINVRTIGHFWNIIPYALTLPSAQNAIHILPIWEPGVVSSLYGPSSWNINPEFYSPALAAAFPQLDTVEKQLRCVVNILHLMGKAVGMDVVPHTDRFSEMALANPQHFEWLQRREDVLLRHDADLYTDVQALVYTFLQQQGPADPAIALPDDPESFFEKWPEDKRLRALFGEKYDYKGRLHRRKQLVNILYAAGYETTPATMAPPYRGLEIDPDSSSTDEEGRVWYDYRITKPEPMSRVFGPLARYRLYASKDNNRNWELDFEKPCVATWTYVQEHYRAIQAEFGIDFMRGDMSHVQMRPDGVPAQTDAFYDLLGAVKACVQQHLPSFAYFAESFLAAPGVMAYGDECDHLEAALADSTLGDLQSEPVGTPKFIRDFAQYDQWLRTRKFAPNFTLITGDKDDPRFDQFYLKGNEIRYFIGLFLTDMPSYMGLGFECRDPHPVPAPNEHYTKLYVFHLPDGPKGTNGPYQWGKNRHLYGQLLRQKELAQRIFPDIEGADCQWLIPPDPEGERKLIAWTQSEQPKYVFLANLDTEQPLGQVEISIAGTWQTIFSTSHYAPVKNTAAPGLLRIGALDPGEGLVLACVD
jgi:hypothetical protein